jgi:hypothetical protein
MDMSTVLCCPWTEDLGIIPSWEKGILGKLWVGKRYNNRFTKILGELRAGIPGQEEVHH